MNRRTETVTWRKLLLPAGIGLFALLSLALPETQPLPLAQAQYHDCTMNGAVIHCVNSSVAY